MSQFPPPSSQPLPPQQQPMYPTPQQQPMYPAPQQQPMYSAPPPMYSAPPPMKQSPKPKRRRWIWIAGIVLLIVIVGAIIGSQGTQSQSTTTSTTQTTQPANQPTHSAATPVLTHAAPTPKPTPAFITFGDGTYQVGKDIKPGTYRTRTGSPGCYYARLSGFGGSVNDIIANNNTDNPAIVTIAASDKGFQSSGCGTWTSDLSQITSSKTSFSDGMYIVGTDITPGTYKDTGGDSCYYARLSGFGNTTDNILANNNASAPAIVTIAASDKGFQSSGCGTWTKI